MSRRCTNGWCDATFTSLLCAARGEVAIEERSFVAEGAPLDDGQRRLAWWSERLGEEDRRSLAPRKALCRDDSEQIGGEYKGNGQCHGC